MNLKIKKKIAKTGTKIQISGRNDPLSTLCKTHHPESETQSAFHCNFYN
jgi:hypothetical protein